MALAESPTSLEAETQGKTLADYVAVWRRELEPSFFAMLVCAAISLGYITFTQLGDSFAPTQGQSGLSRLLLLDLLVLVLLTVLLIARFIRSLGGLSVANRCHHRRFGFADKFWLAILVCSASFNSHFRLEFDRRCLSG